MTLFEFITENPFWTFFFLWLLFGCIETCVDKITSRKGKEE